MDEDDCFDDWCVHPAGETGFCTYACTSASQCPAASGGATRLVTRRRAQANKGNRVLRGFIGGVVQVDCCNHERFSNPAIWPARATLGPLKVGGDRSNAVTRADRMPKRTGIGKTAQNDGETPKLLVEGTGIR